MSDPVDEYLKEKTASSARRAEDDHALVSQWQTAHQGDNVDHDLTHQVMQRFQPTIQTALKKYKAPMTGAGLNVAAKNLTVEALRTYDPSKGAGFNTHLTNTLRRLHRENNMRQDAYAPEAQAYYFGPAQRAHDELHDELGRPPTPEEHEQRLNEMLPENKRLPPGGLTPILSLQKKTVMSSNFEGQPTTFAQDLERQNVDLARYDVHEDDRPIYDAIYRDGVSSTGDIAKRLGMSDPAVSRAKNRIAQTIQSPPAPSVPKAPRRRKGSPPGTPPVM